MGEAAAIRGEATRRRLLEAAVPLIGEAGWHAVTTRMVAQRAGVAPGVVHYHFASVTDLLIAASVGFTRGMLDRFARELAERPGLDAGLGRLLAEVSRHDGADPASLLVAETYLAASRIPRLRDELAELVADFRRGLAGWLAENGAADPEAAATVLGAAVDGLILHRGLDPRLDLAALARPLRSMLRKE
ncbi:TetR family transcriptional regulator [Nonomuraea sp. SMC257]|uniref:TetR family transcriptional regulator n=1 Tax=Nonomuraea montanisoli TaxID=2741721 RepID=A0A7Y6M1M0_9ACTN|nr:TetR family transcriptional regulator [Nonomuraea montanisoli]NUW31803.1 TetR family transcriptional regulator [Nonomuraea montanisoli]